MTCGIKDNVPTQYCIQTHGIYRECDVCQKDKADKRHMPEFLTDVHEESNPTWWQSVTMLEDVHTQEVKLTIRLGNHRVEPHFYSVIRSRNNNCKLQSINFLCFVITEYQTNGISNTILH